MLAILKRAPLSYIETSCKGSHRKLESAAGYPELLFSFHAGDELAPGLVRNILVKDVGLSKEEALKLL